MHTRQHNYAAHMCTCKIICTHRRRGIIACSILQCRHAHCTHTHTPTGATDQLHDLLSYNVNVTTWGRMVEGLDGRMEADVKGSGLARPSHHPLTCSLFHPYYLVEHPHLYSVCTCARTQHLARVNPSVCVGGWGGGLLLQKDPVMPNVTVPKRDSPPEVNSFLSWLASFTLHRPSLSSPAPLHLLPSPPSLILFYPLFHSPELSLPHTLTSVCSHKHFAE